MSELYQYLVKMDNGEEYRTQTFREASMLYQQALWDKQEVYIYQLIVNADGPVKHRR